MSRVVEDRTLLEASKRIGIQIDNYQRERKARFVLNYVHFTGCNQKEAEDIYEEAGTRQINTDSIIQMLGLGYEHKDIQSIIKREGASGTIYAISTYGVKKFEKNKSSDTIGQTSVL